MVYFCTASCCLAAKSLVSSNDLSPKIQTDPFTFHSDKKSKLNDLLVLFMQQSKTPNINIKFHESIILSYLIYWKSKHLTFLLGIINK